MSNTSQVRDTPRRDYRARNILSDLHSRCSWLWKSEQSGQRVLLDDSVKGITHLQNTLTTSGRRNVMKGFVRIPNKLFELKLSVYEFTVMCYLDRCINSYTGMCFPSYNKISTDMNISRSTVIRAVKSLKEKGIIDVRNNFENHYQRSNNYKLTHTPFHWATGLCSERNTNKTNRRINV